MAGYVYVLRPDLKIGGQSVVKIGMTTRSVAKRMRELSTGSPVALELLCSLEVENPKAVEKHLHRCFAAYRINGGGGTEYFKIEPQHVIAEINRIGAEVSKQRARAARDAELRKFKEEIGAGAMERRIEQMGMRLALAIYAVFIALSSLKYGWGALVMVIFPGIIVIGSLHAGITHVLMNRWFKPRFGKQIAIKLEELRPRFPLAYQV